MSIDTVRTALYELGAQVFYLLASESKEKDLLALNQAEVTDWHDMTLSMKLRNGSSGQQRVAVWPLFFMRWLRRDGELLLLEAKASHATFARYFGSACAAV